MKVYWELKNHNSSYSFSVVSIRFKGLGQWVSTSPIGINNGIAVVNRTDGNYFEVVQNIANEVICFSKKSDEEKLIVSKRAKAITDKALWENFFDKYLEAYDFAFNR